MRNVLLITFVFTSLYSFAQVIDKNENSSSMNINLAKTSQDLIYAAKTKEPTDSLVQLLKYTSETELEKQLNDDNQKKAFWINLYNAYTQIILAKNPDKYKKRNQFFGDRQIFIAGRALSLDDIEHGILRHSKIKWSLGHFNKLFPSSFERNNRVNKVDYRIHFALNCGATSCPPIAFYSPDKLDKQLDLATKVYLKGESEFDAAKNEIRLPALMGWFRGDFGGKHNMIDILHKYDIIPAGTHPSIKFKKYNWDLFLANYKSEQ